MSTRLTDSLFRFVEAFFRKHLHFQRASRHTILAYRDGLRMFFKFLGKKKGVSVPRLRLDDLIVEHVRDFLDCLESQRGNGAHTRNLRLTAIKSLCRYLIEEDPTRAGQYQRIISLSGAKTATPMVSYLEPEEIDVLLRQPDRTKMSEFRDYVLLLFLYNTGARITEALTVRPDGLQLDRPFQVQIDGKGRKRRVCPMWPDTARAMQRLVATLHDDGTIFRNLRGRPLTRDGASYILQKHLDRACRELPSLSRRHVTLHTLRHSCAVGLLQAGVDLTVIRDYLGHESIATTGRYTKVNLKMKREALEKLWRHSGLTRKGDPKWRPSKDMLEFLDSL